MRNTSASVLATIEGPIVLVGHSYGGFVKTKAAPGDPDVDALVYIAASHPTRARPWKHLGIGAGLDARTRGIGDPPYTRPTGARASTATSIPGCTVSVFAADWIVARAAVLAVTQRPGEPTTLRRAVRATGVGDDPVVVLVATEDNVIPQTRSGSMAERAGATTVEVAPRTR